jgi:signal transduction histidine kinase
MQAISPQDYLSIEAREFSLQKLPFEVDGFLQEVLNHIYLHANRKHIAINLEKSGEVPQRICSDKHRLQQILLHLLIKAIKYTPQSKAITLRVTLDPLDAHMVIFQIADQGMGIPREKQIHILKRFGISSKSRELGDLEGKFKHGKQDLTPCSGLRIDDHEHAVCTHGEGTKRPID